VRIIGLDVHHGFAVAVFLDGGKMLHGGRVELTRDAVIEATVNTASIARLLGPFVHRVVIANPPRVRAIAHAKIKTDKIDAGAREVARQWLPA
jgi:transposase